MRDQLDAFDEREFDRVEAMVRSMTPFERTHPKHDQRLAPRPHRPGLRRHGHRGQPAARALRQAQKMMTPDAPRRRLPGMPGHAGHARHGGQARPRQPQQRKKGKSGNPAKRAAEERAAAEKAAGPGPRPPTRLRRRARRSVPARGPAGGPTTARPARAAQGLREVPRPLTGRPLRLRRGRGPPRRQAQVPSDRRARDQGRR